MKLIVGLGNPGVRYAGTRHNAGRNLVESIARGEGLKWTRKKSLQASFTQTSWGVQKVCLARPEVFMNLSGESVSSLAAHFCVDLSRDLLIVVDDVALPFGKLRLRAGGSDGGHNGLKSISRLLATTVYPRLRMGIAPLKLSAKIPDIAAFVLECFDRREKKAWEAVLEKTVQACRLWVEKPFSVAMNAINPSIK